MRFVSGKHTARRPDMGVGEEGMDEAGTGDVDTDADADQDLDQDRDRGWGQDEGAEESRFHFRWTCLLSLSQEPIHEKSVANGAALCLWYCG